MNESFICGVFDSERDVLYYFLLPKVNLPQNAINIRWRKGMRIVACGWLTLMRIVFWEEEQVFNGDFF
jgi:hypothetical protein